MIVYRVHWLRARALSHRWVEELCLTQHEMTWTTLYFLRQADEWWWRRWQKNLQEQKNGPAAYAQRMIQLWGDMAMNASLSFSQSNPSYKYLKPIVV